MAYANAYQSQEFPAGIRMPLGGDGAPYRSVGDFGTAPVVELRLGYAAAPSVRLEVLASGIVESGRRPDAADGATKD